MVTFKLKKATSQFFDRDKVLKALDRARHKVFSAYGRLVRKTAQASLIYDESPSKPGQPPHVHKSNTRTRTSKKTGKARTRRVSFLREFIFYLYDKSSKSVVIGPARLESTTSPESLAALEHGGTSRIVSRGKSKRISIAARPFMRPAHEAKREELSHLWKDSIR